MQHPFTNLSISINFFVLLATTVIKPRTLRIVVVVVVEFLFLLGEPHRPKSFYRGTLDTT